MTSTMESDDEYEEALVYVKFEGDANMLMKAEGFMFIDVDGPNPKCEVDGVQFTGHHQINLGTVLFFSTVATEESSNNMQVDDYQQQSAPSECTLVGSSERFLTFKAEAQPAIERLAKTAKKKVTIKKVQEEPTGMDAVIGDNHDR